jgi:hypothetical protein
MHLALAIRLPASYSQTAFNPLSLSPALWLDGADATTLYDAPSGGALVAPLGVVARWEDKSGNGKHATQATAALRPTRTTAANGLGGVKFNDIDQGMATALFLANPFTLFFVCSQKSYVTGYSRVIQAMDFNNLISPIRPANACYVAGDVRSPSWAVEDEVTVTTLAAATGQNFKLSKNSLDITTASLLSTSWGTLSLGATGFYAEPARANILELLAFPTALSAPTTLQVESYLKSKWSVA